MQLQLGPYNNYRSPRVVNAFTEQVLTKTSLLAFERAAERLERAIVYAAQHPAATAVVEQRIHRFLQHAFFVAHDDFRRAQLHQLLETVVAVNDATIEIVQVRRGKPSAVERHQRAQLRRNYRNDIENHPFGPVTRLQEAGSNFQPLRILQLLLLRSFFTHPLAQLDREFLDLHHAQQFFDCFGAHLGDKLRREITHQLAIALVGK